MSKNSTQAKSQDQDLTTDPKDDFSQDLTEDQKAQAAEEAEKELQRKIKAAQGKGTYLPKENERHLYHVKVGRPGYSPKSGKKINKDYKQMFGIKDFANMKANAGNLGLELTVLWNPEAFADPEGYAEKLKKEAAAAKAKAEKEAK